MKKSITSILLAACILLPACGQFMLGALGGSSSESSFSSTSSTMTSNSENSWTSSSSSSSESSSESWFSSSSYESSQLESSSESFSESFLDSSYFESSSESFFDSSYEESSSDSSQQESSSDSSSADEHGDTHTDENDDGRCDECKTKVTVTVDVIAVNDLHGKFADTDAQEGVDELSTYIKETKAMNKNTIVLSSGDMWQGSAESNLTKGNIITEWMNAMNFVSMTIGNHEYDWGEEYVVQNSELAEFPFLAINIFERDTDELVDYCQPSIMVEQSGVQIGIIGAVGDCYSSISSDKVGDIYFKTGRDLTNLVKAESEKLRGQGADFIIYSIHDGYERSYSTKPTITSLGYYDTVLSNGYVDLVFEGHTHQRYVFKDGYGVYHMQNGGDNDGVSHAQITINYANGNTAMNEAEFVSIDEYTDLSDDPIVETLMDKYEEQISLASKVLGENRQYRTSDEILSMCAQLYYQKGLDVWGDKYDIVLGGGFMSARSPYSLQAGTVTYGDLQSILPFDNQIVLCSISGYDLKTKFFETTKDRYYIYYDSYGEQVKANIQNNKTYYIITDTYTSTYRYNNCTEIARLDETTFARDLLAAYIEQGGFA